MAMVGRQEKTIMFDVSKREVFTPSSGLATLRRKLQTNFKVSQNKDVITLTVLREASLVMFVGPRERFSSAEFEAMKEYLNQYPAYYGVTREEFEEPEAQRQAFCAQGGDPLIQIRGLVQRT